MKRIVILLSIFLICRVGSSQEAETLKDGYHIFKYPNGAVSSEGTIKNGKPEGFWKSYYVTGVKKSEGRRTNFMLDSIWIFYDQAGDTTEKISYLYGKKNGWYYKYKKDPAVGVYIWSKELFAGDKKEGTAYVYYPDGKIQQTFSYNDGKKEGISKEYDKDGNIITLYEYSNDFLVSMDRINRVDKNGLKQGDWKEYYPNGKIKSEKNYVNDLLNGYYKEYDEKGKLVVTMLYDNGAMVKSRVEDEPDIEVVNKLDPGGNLIYSGYYRNKVPVGIHREYGKDGKVSNAFIYNDNGVLLSEGIVEETVMENGKTCIAMAKYRQKGNILTTGEQENGSFIPEKERLSRQAHIITGDLTVYGPGIMIMEQYYGRKNISRVRGMVYIQSILKVVK
jgi:antitoxin component YwqK of YwqJK toxin-antitoxin module